MEYLFQLADGRYVALWSERNQIGRLVFGNGSRSYTVFRNDFLADFSAVMYGGGIWFVYRNTSEKVMLYSPGGEEDVVWFGETVESCRHGGLTLTAWKGEMYLFYTAWNPIRESYALNVRRIPSASGRNREVAVLPVRRPTGEHETGEEFTLLRDLGERPEFQVQAGTEALLVLAGEGILRMTVNSEGIMCWENGEWISGEARRTLESERVDLRDRLCEQERENGRLRDQILELEREVGGFQEQIEACEGESLRIRDESETRLRLVTAQYNELADLARKLQQEGKRWKERYQQEVRKGKERKS